MSAKPLAEVYEALKQARRRGDWSGVAPAIADISDRLPDLRTEIADFDQSANLIRTLDIRTLADRVFGDEEKAGSWLQRPNTSLAGQQPINLLKDELGAAVVRETLEQIDSGIFA
jgi:putative toxin-antitoxin system antitoxin component (TIGR02293 family)